MTNADKISFKVLLFSEGVVSNTIEATTKATKANYYFEITNNNGLKPDQFLSYIKLNRPDIIVSDVFRTGYDILYLINNVKTIPNYKPLIIATGELSNTVMIDIIINSGCDYYMRYPITLDHLLTTILMIKTLISDSCTAPIEQISEKPANVGLYTKIDRILSSDFGIPYSLSGFSYIRDSIVYVMDHGGSMMDIAITKELYPYVAKKNKTTPSRVERAIRHAIEKSFEKCVTADVVYKYFGNSCGMYNDKPTNTLFLSTICQKLCLDAQ